MKHLLTAIACCLAVAGSAQTPYNPDSNGDNFVDIADFLDFLPNYGQNFYPTPVSPSSSVAVITDNVTTELADHYIIPISQNQTMLCPQFSYFGSAGTPVYIVTEPLQNNDNAEFANGTLFEFIYPAADPAEFDFEINLCSAFTYEYALGNGGSICEALNSPLKSIVIQHEAENWVEEYFISPFDENYLALMSVTYKYFEGSIVRLH